MKPKTDTVNSMRLRFVSGRIHPPKQEVQISFVPKASPLLPSRAGPAPGHEAEPEERIKVLALPFGRS